MRVGRQHGANMAPNMAPSWSQNRTKIDTENDQKTEGFEIDFCEDVGGFGEAKWN